MGALKAYAPKDNKYVEAKNKLVNNVKNFYKGREKIVEGFKNGVFPLHYDERQLESPNIIMMKGNLKVLTLCAKFCAKQMIKKQIVN